jgi:hypothetical protein
VPYIDLVDETFIAASPATLAEVVHDEKRWAQWWPDLTLQVFMDRGPLGIRWSATGDPRGSIEIWLEPVADGVLVHHYVRLDPLDRSTGQPRPEPTDAAGWRKAARLRADRARQWKLHVWALKDELEAGRRPGTPV